MAAGRTSEAIAAMERATASAPIIGQDYLYDTLGTLYIGDANLSGALGAYRRRVSVNPNHSDAHRKLGQIYLELGRHEEAAAEFTAAALLDPANAEAHAGRAQVYFRRGEYDAAGQSARRALALKPAHLAAQYTLGASLLRLGRTAEGTEALEIFRGLQEAAQAAADREWALKLRRLPAQPDR
jgi:tetratricopeptide (TPR) repeat protein